MRHSVGIRVWCGKVCNLHGMVGFGERSIRWVLAFWVAGFGRSETDKRRFLPSFSWGPVGQKPAFERRLARGGKEAPGKARGVFESPRLLGLTRTLSPSLRLGLLQENAISTVRALA